MGETHKARLINAVLISEYVRGNLYQRRMNEFYDFCLRSPPLNTKSLEEGMATGFRLKWYWEGYR